MAKRLWELLRTAAADLARCGVEEPRLVAEWLLSDVLACGRLELPLRYAEELDDGRAQVFEQGVERLAAGEPLQYVTGEADFMGLRLRVDRRALIPRPETEGLVREVLDCAALWRRSAPELADIGTGSGCIAICLAVAHPDARILARDVSVEALDLAQENARRHVAPGTLRFERGDLLEGLDCNTLDAVVANLPYVPTQQCARLPRHIREHEPRQALDGGADGLRLIFRLVEQAPRVLRSGGFLFLELGADQAPAVQQALAAAGFQGVRMVPDLAGRARVAVGQRSGGG